MASLKIGFNNAASITPIKPDGSLDRGSAKKLAKRWVRMGMSGVMILGTMGEGRFLSDATRNAFVEASVNNAGDKLTIFATVADLSRQRMIERARAYAKIGAPCVVVCVSPGASPARGVADVLAVADASPVPVAYYDIPENTGVSLVLNDFLPIMKHKNVVAIKDSSGNGLLAQALTSDEFKPKSLALLHGNEYCTVHSVLLGYDGALHGGGAVTGGWVKRIWEAAKAGRLDEANAEDRAKAMCLAGIYNRFSRPLQNIVGQKHALKLLGDIDGDAVVVDQSFDDASRARVAKTVHQYHDRLA